MLTRHRTGDVQASRQRMMTRAIARTTLLLCLATGLFGLSGTLAAETNTGHVTPPKVNWGNPDQPWGKRRPVTTADRAAIVAYRAANRKAVVDEAFTDPAELGAEWTLQSDDTASLKSCRRPDNVVIAANELQLRTLVAAGCRSPWSTGSMISRFHQRYGLFEARVKSSDVSGINNAFWLVTDDRFEIDVAEIHDPGTVRVTLHNNNGWDVQKDDKMHAVGFNLVFVEDLSRDYHDYGVLWTPTSIIYEVDGDPVAAIATDGAIKGTADVRFSTAVTEYAGRIPANPAGHHMYVRRLRVVAFDPSVK